MSDLECGGKRYPARRRLFVRVAGKRCRPSVVTALQKLRKTHGGSWIHAADYARCGYSYWIYPDYAGSIGGFRAVCR